MENRPTNTAQGSAGYSTAELMTVVFILGLVVAISIPALFQLFPGYRIRAGATQLVGAAAMARQKAISGRAMCRLSLDTNADRYAMFVLTGTDPAVPSNWRPVGSLGQPLAAADPPLWQPLGSDLRPSPTNPFHDVDGDGFEDLIFLTNGSVADLPAASATARLTFSALPEIVVANDSLFTRFNRYKVRVTRMGQIQVVPVRE